MLSKSRLGLGAVALVFYVLVSGFNGCQEAQQNGTVHRGTAATKTLQFSGRSDEPNASITIQMLRSPDRVPDNTAANWTAVRNLRGTTAPLTWNDSLPYYDWSASGGVTIAHGAAWPLGGVLRLRTLINSPSSSFQLNAFDEDYSACSQANASSSWLAIGQTCESDYPRPKVTHVVSTANNPALAEYVQQYLTRKRSLFDLNNIGYGYYSRLKVDVFNRTEPTEIPDLNAFKARYLFGSPGNGEITAYYYNRGDLGLGREMHCRRWSGSAGDGAACYVTNYKGAAGRSDDWGAFNPNLEQQAISDAVAHTRSFATVAMVYNSNTDSLPAADKVTFLVFNGSGELRANLEEPNLKLQYTAQLENHTAFGLGGEQIPSNCITCHGGSASVGLDGKGVITNAYFLPFDVQAMRFSNSDSRYNRANQEEAFRKLNALVAKTNVRYRVERMIDGWYGGDVDHVGNKFDNDYVPDGWRNSGQVPAAEKLYKYVFEPYCQGCHVSQNGPFAFASAVDFVNAKAAIIQAVCGNPQALNADADDHVMPHAEMTMYNFWNSGARGHLLAALDARGACN